MGWTIEIGMNYRMDNKVIPKNQKHGYFEILMKILDQRRRSVLGSQFAALNFKTVTND